MQWETGRLRLAEAPVGGGKGGARLERIADALAFPEAGAPFRLEINEDSTGAPTARGHAA